WARAHRAEALRREDHVVTPIAEPSAEDLLRPPDGRDVAADGVDVGGVEERHPGVERAVEDRHRRLLVALHPERHGAETEARDRESGAAEARVLHGRHSLRGGPVEPRTTRWPRSVSLMTDSPSVRWSRSRLTAARPICSLGACTVVRPGLRNAEP